MEKSQNPRFLPIFNKKFSTKSFQQKFEKNPVIVSPKFSKSISPGRELGEVFWRHLGEKSRYIFSKKKVSYKIWEKNATSRKSEL